MHWRHRAVVPTQPHGIDGRQAIQRAPLFYEALFSTGIPFDKEAALAQPMGNEREA